MSKIPTAGKRTNLPICIVSGGLVSVVIAIGACMILAGLILSEKIGQVTITAFSYGIIAVASFSGALIGALLAGRRYILMGVAASGVGFSILVLMNVLLFNGKFGGLIWGVTVAVCCGIAGGFVPALSKGRGIKRIRKYRFG